MSVAAHTPLVARSFFGVHRVRLVPAADLVVLQHGTTFYGMQSTRPGEELTPLGYYHRAGPFGRFFAALARRPEPVSAVGVLGLGTGVLGCYARPGEAWTFHEIDPVVERLARDGRWFRFMAGCGNDPAVVLGDARVTLANTGNRYDVLVVDVFSSDGVPAHLLTREALALYFARLKPGGVVLFHVSNRYLDLVPVVARLAADAGPAPAHVALRRAFPAGERRRSGGGCRPRRRPRRARGRRVGGPAARPGALDRRALGHPGHRPLAVRRPGRRGSGSRRRGFGVIRDREQGECA